MSVTEKHRQEVHQNGEHAPRLVVEILGHKPLWLDWTLSQIGSSIIESRSYFPVLFIRLAKQLLKGKEHCSWSHQISIKESLFDRGLQD